MKPNRPLFYWVIRRVIQFGLLLLFLLSLGAIAFSSQRWAPTTAIVFGGFLFLSLWAERHTRQVEQSENLLDSQKVKNSRNRRAILFFCGFISICSIAILIAKPNFDFGSFSLIVGLVGVGIVSWNIYKKRT